MINIRPAQISDIEHLTDLSIKFEKFFQQLENNYYEIPRGRRRDEIIENNFGAAKFMRTLVAENDGQVVGAISFYPGYLNENPPRKVFHLPFLFVTEKFRGRVTMILLESVREIAISNGIRQLIFSVYGRNIRAKQLYEHIGAKYWTDEDEHFMFYDL